MKKNSVFGFKCVESVAFRFQRLHMLMCKKHFGEDRTAFMMAVESGGRFEIMKLLFKVGADINVRNKLGETALSLARKRYGVEKK